MRPRQRLNGNKAAGTGTISCLRRLIAPLRAVQCPLAAILALCLLCLFPRPIGFGAPAHAQSDADITHARQVPKANAAPLSLAPKPTYRPRRRYDPPQPLYPDDATLGLIMPDIKLGSNPAADESRIRIALIGDSLAEALALGLEADPGLKSDYAFRQKLVSASGLVREDYFDWPKALSALLAETRGFAALIVLVGLNDRQIIRQNGENLEPLSEAWRDMYRQRVDALLAVAAKAGLPVLWVGLPPMRQAKLSSELALINALQRDQVGALGQSFVEISDAFADASGEFSATGPDILGDHVRLRAADGIHFTSAGQRKLAFFVARALRKLLGERQLNASGEAANIGFVPSALPEIDPLKPSETSAETRASGDFALPIAAPGALAIPIGRQRPAIGELRNLGAISAAPRLIEGGRQIFADEISRDLFDRGLPPPTRPGRADDFSWR